MQQASLFTDRAYQAWFRWPPHGKWRPLVEAPTQSTCWDWALTRLPPGCDLQVLPEGQDPNGPRTPRAHAGAC